MKYLKINKVFVFLTLFFARFMIESSKVMAQITSKKAVFTAESGVRASPGMVSGCLSVWAYRGFGGNQKFTAGVGLRHTSHIFSESDFITAPAEFTSDENNLDTLQISSGIIHSINLGLDLRYRISRVLAVGFNIDLSGLSYGPKRTGRLKGFIPVIKPTPYNILLVGDRDIGTLNSELYLIYRFTQKWALKLSGTYLYTEYKTDKKYISGIDNNRYRNKSIGLSLGFERCF